MSSATVDIVCGKSKVLAAFSIAAPASAVTSAFSSIVPSFVDAVESKDILAVLAVTAVLLATSVSKSDIVLAVCVPVWLALASVSATVLPQSFISLPVVLSYTAIFSSTALDGHTTSHAHSQSVPFSAISSK